MKPLIVAGALAVGILFTGCGATIIERDHHHGYGYRGDSPAVYVDSGYRGGHDHGYDNRDYRGDYRTRNVERTNVNINETTVNRTVVNQSVKKSPHVGGQPAPQAQTNVPKKGGDKDHKGHDKKKDGDQQ